MRAGVRAGVTRGWDIRGEGYLRMSMRSGVEVLGWTLGLMPLYSSWARSRARREAASVDITLRKPGGVQVTGYWQ